MEDWRVLKQSDISYDVESEENMQNRMIYPNQTLSLTVKSNQLSTDLMTTLFSDHYVRIT